MSVLERTVKVINSDFEPGDVIEVKDFAFAVNPQKPALVYSALSRLKKLNYL